MRKILMVIAKVGFRDEEFDIPCKKFRSKGYRVDVASSESGDCIGKLGMHAIANLSFQEVMPSDYAAVSIVGGPGSANLVGNRELEKILLTMSKDKKVISAICFAPVILAKSGLLKGKKATVWDEDGLQSKILTDSGAHYIKQSSVIDGLIVTADGPSSADMFATNVLQVIEGRVSG